MTPEQEIKRLRLENQSLVTKNRELEETIAMCIQRSEALTGRAAALARDSIRLRDVISTYRRGEEPTVEDLADIGHDGA